MYNQYTQNGDKGDVRNYRHVMILSLAETLLEEILLDKILNSFKSVINPLSMASILYPGSKVSNVLYYFKSLSRQLSRMAYNTV